MNYYNPYFSSIPYTSALSPTKGGLFGRLFGNINFSTILSGTQKTLNIVNQAIPLIKQAQPILQNTKTMFKVMNEFKKIDTPIQNTETIILNKDNSLETNEINNIQSYNNSTGPTFFI